MSHSAAKATRRELRRALGPRAVDAVDSQAKAIVVLKGRIEGLEHHLDGHCREYREFSVGMHRRRAELDERIGRLEGAVRAHTRRLEALEAFQALGFFGRLRWLLLGR